MTSTRGWIVRSLPTYRLDNGITIGITIPQSILATKNSNLPLKRKNHFRVLHRELLICFTITRLHRHSPYRLVWFAAMVARWHRRKFCTLQWLTTRRSMSFGQVRESGVNQTNLRHAGLAPWPLCHPGRVLVTYWFYLWGEISAYKGIGR